MGELAEQVTKRDRQLKELEEDLKGAKTLKEWAWLAIQAGTDPKYVAKRYGFTVEEMQRAKEVHEQRKAEKATREARGIS